MASRRSVFGLIKTPKGLLIVSSKKGKYKLPGGGVKPKESIVSALKRELLEETNLKVRASKKLYNFNHDGESVHIFEVRHLGSPKPNGEIKRIAYLNPKLIPKLSKKARKALALVERRTQKQKK